MIVRTRRKWTHRAYLQALGETHGSIELLERKSIRDPTLRALVDEWRWLASHPERDDEPLVVDTETIFHDVGL